MFEPECFEVCRRFISAETPSELERYTSVLNCKQVKYRCLVYSDNGGKNFSDAGFRIDILMSYRKMDEEDILQALGIKRTELYLYFEHS